VTKAPLVGADHQDVPALPARPSAMLTGNKRIVLGALKAPLVGADHQDVPALPARPSAMLTGNKRVVLGV
jgi:hypothetical protein